MKKLHDYHGLLFQMLEQNEKHLRAQIELYTEKYDEFQSTLSKSNTVSISY